MLCCFCSLLCDREDLHRGCDIRSDALKTLNSYDVTKESSHSKSQSKIDEIVESLRRRLVESTSILMTGRIYSVETSRAVLQSARSLEASLDASELGWAINNAFATARNGAFTTSLADSRATSQTFIVLDDGSLLDRFPRLPHALCLCSGDQKDSRTVLLLGSPTSAAIETWTARFPNTWSVPCAMEHVTNALNQWTSHRKHLADNTSSSWLDDLRASTYTSILWSPACLSSVSQPDLWIEDLMHWIRSQNEETRCSSLTLSGLDSTFQQVCTWTTGFPGRIRFRNENTIFEPMESNYLSWINRQCNDPNALIVSVDESVKAKPFLPKSVLDSFAGTIVELHGRSLEVNQNGSRVRLPIRTAGYEMDATISRADQVVMAFVPRQSPTADEWPTPAEWLARLST
jgi:formylmethanofuran dehydrogenase subunit B